MWCPRMGRPMDRRALSCGTHPSQHQTARVLAARASTCRTLRDAREAAPKGVNFPEALQQRKLCSCFAIRKAYEVMHFCEM